MIMVHNVKLSVTDSETREAVTTLVEDLVNYVNIKVNKHLIILIFLDKKVKVTLLPFT